MAEAPHVADVVLLGERDETTRGLHELIGEAAEAVHPASDISQSECGGMRVLQLVDRSQHVIAQSQSFLNTARVQQVVAQQ